MKLIRFRRELVSFLILLCFSAICLASGSSDLLLWFDAPATKFTQSLPLGNGRLGAMVFGGIDEEKIILNESWHKGICVIC